MIKVEPVYKYVKAVNGKSVISFENVERQTSKYECCTFEHFKAIIGDKEYYPVPIKFLRRSELPNLEQMLKDAYEHGKDDQFYDSEEV